MTIEQDKYLPEIHQSLLSILELLSNVVYGDHAVTC